MARYKPLQMKYNTQLSTEIKDFLPIVGNKIPNKRLWLFDEAGVASGFAFAQTGGTATGALNYNNAYHGNACYKITMATNSSAIVTLTPTTAINLLQLGETVTNNYARIKRVMKYGSDIDKAVFILNLQKSNNTATTTVQIKLYNGTKTATSTAASLAAAGAVAVGYNEKLQWRLDAVSFTFAAGFLAADFESVTKIDIIFNSSGAAAVNYYIHDVFSALPQHVGTPDSSIIPLVAYYVTPTVVSSIYVSNLFGDDANAGTSQAAAVKTIEKALTLCDGTRLNIVILDSETYAYGQSPTWEDAVSYTNALATSVTLWAGYLETPTITSEAGLTAPQRCGARLYYRSNFSEATNVYINQTTGNDATGARNDSTKPFKTLQAGVTAATSGDVVTITDSATYNEYVVVDDNMTIQAGAKFLPVLKDTGGNTALTFSGTKTVTIDGLTIQGNAATADVTVVMLSTTTLTMKNCTFTGSGTSAGGTSIKTDGALTLLNSNFTGNGTGGAHITRTLNAAAGVFCLNCKSYTDTNFYTVSTATTHTAQFFHLCEFSKINKNEYRFSIKKNILCSLNLDGYGTSTFYIHGNKFDAVNYPGTETIYGIFLNTSATTSVYRIKYNFFDLSTVTSYNYTSSFVKSGIKLNYTSTGTTDTVISNNIFYGSGGVGILNSSCGKFDAATIKNNYFIQNYNGFFSHTLTDVGGLFININTLTNCVFDKCRFSEYCDEEWDGQTTNGCEITSVNGLYYSSPPYAAPTANVTRTTESSVTTSNFSGNNDLRILPTSPILTKGAATWLDGVAPIFTSTGLNLALAWLNFTGSGAVVNLNTAAKTVSAQYCNFDGFNYALALSAGSISVQNCNFINCGTGLLQNVAALTAHTVKYNIFESNITGAIIAGGIDFEYNTLSKNSYGVYSSVTGLSSLYDFALQYVIIKNNIITKSIIYDYTGSTPTDYNMISKRRYAASAGLNDIDSGALLDGAYLYPAIIPLGYYSNDEAYGGSSAGSNINIGARYLKNIKSTLSSSNYVFASHGSGANIWAYENPNKFKYNLTPINLSSTRTLSGDYNASATGYAKEWTLAWLEAGTEGRINAPLKAALEVAYQSYWIIGLSFDDAATYTYYKVKKENSLQSEQLKYIFDTLPEGSATFILIEIPLFNINNYVIIVNMT